MREIKFRGKEIKSGDWVSGNLSHYPNEKDAMIESVSSDDKKVLVTNHFVDPDTIGQFTGLRDKNGKEIYEGDILSVASKSDKPFGVVMWHKEGYFCVEDHLSVSEPSDHISIGKLLRVSIFEFEVIGNIYDNPDLLKQ